GLVVNEAMASSLPVLVSNRCGCAQDLVRQGENGFLFDPNDAQALASLMSRISGRQFNLAAFGSSSRKLVNDSSPELFAERAELHFQQMHSLAQVCPKRRKMDRHF